MKYLIIIAALLAGALAVAVKLALASGRRARELKTALESARDELRRVNEYRKQREEAQNNADEKM
jgi:hypothetical protein